MDCWDPGKTLTDTKECLSDIIEVISTHRSEVHKITGEYQLFSIFTEVK